jgi:hypothetical protein
MSSESYEDYVERRRADKSIVRKQNKHLWFVLITGLAFYGCSSIASRQLDEAAAASDHTASRHRSGANPWALEKTTQPAAGKRAAH